MNQIAKISTLAADVDELLVLLAKASEINKAADKIKARLKASGETEIDGTIARATISHSTRETLDMDAVRAKLSPQFIAAHTNSTDVVTVRVVARIV